MPETPQPQPHDPRSRGLRTKLRALLREVSKFGTVGAISFAIDLFIFNVLLQTGVETLLAKTISTVFATTVAFTGNRFWTWRHRTHDNMARQYTMFFVLNAIGLGIGLACLAISHYGLGQIWPELRTPLADNISGQFVGTAVGTLFRFWSYRRFVFRDTSPPDQGGSGQQSGRPTTNVATPSPVRDSA
ncbi:GtrA family protein [Actinoplanes ferrugineus]|uniref:GtrA family protein n=1 Tax=Paractinoplanes ferrugineus TaxID=113564 RepID=UPI0019441854